MTEQIGEQRLKFYVPEQVSEEIDLNKVACSALAAHTLGTRATAREERRVVIEAITELLENVRPSSVITGMKDHR